MTTVVALVEEANIDRLTKRLVANGWGDNYSLIDSGNTADPEAQLHPFDLSDEEMSFYADSIRKGGVFVTVEVDDEYRALVKDYFAKVDAQHVKTA